MRTVIIDGRPYQILVTIACSYNYYLRECALLPGSLAPRNWRKKTFNCFQVSIAAAGSTPPVSYSFS